MSEAGNFDEHIKHEFSNYSPNVSPRIWDRIVAEREKRRPAGFWFTLFTDRTSIWIAGLILAGVIGAGLFVFHSSTTNTSFPAGNNTTTHIKKNENNAPVVTNTIRDKDNLENSTSIEMGNSSNSNPSTNKIKTSTTSLDKPGNKETGNDISAIDKTSSTVTIEKNLHPVSRSKHVISHWHTANSSAIINQPSVVDINNENISVDNNENTGVDNETTSDNNNILIPADESQPQGVKNDQYKAVKKYLQNRFLSGIEKISVSTANGELSSKQKNIPAINLPECPAIEKDAAANKRYFEVYLGPDYGLRTLTDTTNSVYLAKRKESSSFTSGFSAGVRYTKVFNNGMSLRAALNFSQINEKFTFVQGSVVQITYIIDPNTGDTTGSYTIRGTRYKTTYNHYRSIDIPLTIGYELGNGRLHANINVGVIANIYSWQKGDVLDTNYQPVNITTGKGSAFYQFKTNVGLGATGGVSLYYKLTDQLHLLAEPYLRYNFQPMSTDNLSLKQKYTTIGLRLGLRVDLP